MTAPLLTSIISALNASRLEAILIGNAAAAIQGAPVTTVNFDFMFRSSPTNLTKLKKLARELDAIVLRPYYPVSNLYRVMNDDRGLQVDFMSRTHGVASLTPSVLKRSCGRSVANPLGSPLEP